MVISRIRTALLVTAMMIAACVGFSASPALASPTLDVTLSPSPYGVLFTVRTSATVVTPVVEVTVTSPGQARTAKDDVCQRVFGAPVECTSNHSRVYVDGLTPNTEYTYEVRVQTADGSLGPAAGRFSTFALPDVSLPGLEPPRESNRYVIQRGKQVKQIIRDLGVIPACVTVSISRSQPRFALAVTQRQPECPDYGYGGIILTKGSKGWAWQAADFEPTCKMTGRIFKSLSAPASVNRDMRLGGACAGA